ncbi:MAG: NAD(P)H-hydrate dehydratase [Deltaproteobacteria bacterium]|jgi:NAD(P)H-hydrate epimerase|nr:NAD(P)H-hydrate dehydratase [Deltaproteobacteria bacterium]
MYVTTSRESRLLDKVAIEGFGLPGIVLMENAARSILKEALEFWPDLKKKRQKVLVLAGPGQNGGDGFVLARLFFGLGHAVHCYLVRKPGQEPKGDAGINYDILKKLIPQINIIETDDDDLPDFATFDLVIDALFGTGLDRPLGGQAARVLAAAGAGAKFRVGERPFRVLAVDLPSGLSGDTGAAGPEVLAADLTVSLGTYKLGQFLLEGPELCGAVRLGDIGLLPDMFFRAMPDALILDDDQALSLVPKRPKGGHKGTFGHAVLCGGSAGKTGALVLAALGAQRSGCGKITAAHPASLDTVFQTKLTSAMTLPLIEYMPGELSSRAAETIWEFMADKDVLALGPGLGLKHESHALVIEILKRLDKPMVLDADALTILAENFDDIEALKSAKNPRVLTPHPGEASRLLGISALEVQADRPKAARELAQKTNSVVILKGHNTLVAAIDRPLLINLTGGPVLATGGSGDLLTGLVAGLMAQGLPPFDAAALGVYLHGLAADLAAKHLTDRAIFPSEIQACLPEAWKTLLAHEPKCHDYNV